MENNHYQVLLVGDLHPEGIFDSRLTPQPSEYMLQIAQVTTYPAAIFAVEQDCWDAILVVQNFDHHSGLELIHHTRLLGCKIPIVLITQEYDPGLDYKARRIGATDCLAARWVDLPYLKTLFRQAGMTLPRRKKKTGTAPLVKVVEALRTSL